MVPLHCSLALAVCGEPISTVDAPVPRMSPTVPSVTSAPDAHGGGDDAAGFLPPVGVLYIVDGF